MIENDDIDGLRAIIKAMPDLIGSSIKELEDEQGSSFVEKTFCYDDKIHLEALKILINDEELSPNIVSGEARTCKDLPLVDYLAKKINESKGNLQARYKEALKILDSRDFN